MVSLNKKKSVRDMAFKGYGIELHPVKYADLPILRRWRNNPQISRRMVNNSYITSDQQRLWYQKIKERFDQAHWVVLYKGVRTGFVSIKGEGPLELQKQLTGGMYRGDSQVRHKLLGYAMQMMVLDIVFEHLSVSEFQGPVQKDNSSVRRLLQQLGFREKKYKDDFVWTTICSSDFKTSKKKFLKYFADARCKLIK